MSIIVFMKYYSYENFRDDTNRLVTQIKKFDPQVVVGIARGGLTLAHAVAEGLDIRDIQILRTELYDDQKIRENISVFGECDFQNKERVIVLDDIADSGKTLQTVMDQLKKNNSNVEFRVATLFYKKISVYKPDIWINEATEWIEFFWEKDFSSTAR